MTVSRASGAGLCGAGSITLSGGKGRTRETKDQESGSKFIKDYEQIVNGITAKDIQKFANELLSVTYSPIISTILAAA